MFAKLALPLIAASAFATGVFSSPVSVSKDTAVARRHHDSSTSFNNWNGISSLNNFDNFYGSDNFNGYTRSQTVVESQEVCHSTDITIIQQRLAVLQEMAKRIITEQICEVETQVITFEQYYQSLGHFRGDLRRHSGYKAGHDKNIVSHFGKIYNSDGSFCTDDWSFTGHDVGSQTVVVQDNWNDQTSPTSVGAAYYNSRDAYYVNRYS
ncbi:hypothetical protein B0H16DRAFT_1409186 [Mycena metata]|uniref:Uncharacterized protein n=1 Tax=Mycena metata TaxID=1033252 RepID=A0AAD7JW78_9AGAR|nr:hypothetical protein B0H16DRAFT_1409186 [Mycena metata]